MELNSSRCFKYILLFLAILYSSITYSAESSVTFACNDFPPQKIKSTGDFRGIDIDILSESFKIEGINSTYKFLPWKRALSKVRSGAFDGLCSCSYLKSRESDFLFSNKIGMTSVGVFVLKKNKVSITKLEDLKHMSVAVIRGYNLESELKKININATPVNQEIQLIKMLKAKRVDAIYSFKKPIEYIIQKNNLGNNFIFHELRNSSYYTCFSKKKSNSAYLLKTFNSGLEKIQKNGIYEKILRKYLGH